MGGAEGVEDLGGFEALFGPVHAVEEGRDVQVEGGDRGGMGIGVDGLGLPEIGLGDPEAVPFRTLRGRGGARGDAGPALLAKSMVSQPFGDGADGHPEVAVAQQRSVREFPGGHQDGGRLEHPGVPCHLMEGLGGHAGVRRVWQGAQRDQ